MHIYRILNTRHIFPSFSSKKSDFIQLIFVDKILDYSEIEFVGSVSNTPEIKEIDILYAYENTSFTLLMIWIRINFPIILLILIIIRFFRKTATTIEQKACSLLNLATIFYDQPLSILNFYKPTPLTVYLDIIFSDIYGPVLFFVSMFLISRTFDQKLTQTMIYLPFIYFGTTFFLSSINFLVHYPCDIPDQLGSLAFDLEYLNTFISFIYFCLFCYYMIVNIQHFAGDPGFRLSTYRTIVLFVSIGISIFSVLQAENSVRESLFSGIFQFGLVNTLSIVMEYMHSNKEVFLKDIYEEPMNLGEFSDNAIGEAISSDFSDEVSYSSEQYE